MGAHVVSGGWGTKATGAWGKDRGPGPQRLGLKSGEVPCRLSILQLVRAGQDSGAGSHQKGLRFPRGQRRGQAPGARRTLPGCLFSSLADGTGPAAASQARKGDETSNPILVLLT